MSMTDTKMLGRKPRTNVNFWSNLAGGAVDVVDQYSLTVMAQKTLDGKMTKLEEWVVGVHNRRQIDPKSVTREEIDAANSIAQNLLNPGNYGVDGSVPWKRLSKEQGAAALLRTLEQYAPALIGIMESRSPEGTLDPTFMKELKRRIVEQGLTEAEAYKTFK